MLSIIVPCFNEEESLPYFVQEVEKISAQIDHSLEYVLVNDGSSDGTLAVFRDLYQQMPDKIRYISLSRNFGKESALYAGLKAAKGDLVTVMDADLQDPPELLPQMIQRIENADIDCVGTRRADRDGEPPVRSFFARLFYKIVNKFGDTEMVDG